MPLVTTRRHANILAKIRSGIQFDALHSPKTESPKNQTAISFLTQYAELHETNDRDLFSQTKIGKDLVPVWKGESFDQYDPHGRHPIGYGAWESLLSYVQKKRIRSPKFNQLATRDALMNPNTHPVFDYRVVFRDITNRTNSRTVISCIVPPRTLLTNKAPYLIFGGWSRIGQSYVLGVLNSTPFDWLARRYVETNVNYYILNILCFPTWESAPWQRIGALAARLSCVDDRYAEFAAESGVECGPLADDERDDMLAEIDALVARAYGLTKDEMEFIFTDFTENSVDPAYRELVLSKLADREE